MLPLGTRVCPTCGIRLTGPLALELWEVEQRIGALSAESKRLRALLLEPPSAQELARTPRPPAPPAPGVHPPYPVPHAGPHRAPHPTAPPRSSLSGQQVLLGMAAFLLLSGVSFFLLVIWTMIGLIGQALVMVVLTGLAAGGAVLATRKRLPAAAETAAVIATGLVLLDLAAAHRLGLAGLDAFPGEQYWSVAGLLGAGLLLGFDALVPRRDAAGDLRRIVTYRPVAVLFALVALWSAAAVLNPEGVPLSLTGLALAGVSVALARGAMRLDGRTGLVSPSSVAPLLSAVAALALHLHAAFDTGYSADVSTAVRFAAMVLLALVPCALLVLQARADLRTETRFALRVVGLLGLLVTFGIPLYAAPRGVVAIVAVGVGVALLVLALRGHDGVGGRAPLTWGDLLSWVGRLALLLLFVLLLALAEGGHASGIDLQVIRGGAGPAAWWLPVLPAAALAVPSVVTAVRRDSLLIAVVAHASLLAAVLAGLRDADPITWAVTALVGAVLSLAVAGGARWAALESRSPGMEPLAFAAATVYAVTAVLSAADVDSFVLTTVLAVLGALLVAYAALPGRLEIGYLAILALASASYVQLVDRDVSTVEWYTLPVAAMLAVLGTLQWLRDRKAPTFLTMAPAIVFGLFPSLMVGVLDGPVWRLLAATLAAALLLVVGIAGRWKAAVVLGALALAFVALTQGGPLVAYVPGFLLLVGSGAVLLVIGVLWEYSIALGRRTYAWLEAMQ